jgi:superfamily II DNA or RNA helicase
VSLAEKYTPGELLRARGREWVVVESGEVLRIRPLTGAESEIESIVPELEAEPVGYAAFDPPEPGRSGGREAAQLLRDALRLSLRRGAGPFRSAGKINFEPRAYQLAPLMMALRQEIVRLLIADDVGVGKTIEAGLILREFLDRGEIDRFTVLCPPHLVEQWTAELEEKFSIPATPVTASAAARLERDLPHQTSVFEAYPFTVVSLDFIKSERRFFDFKRACPEMVVVDEAHAAVFGGRGRQRRYELVKALADDEDRHLMLLTATPHSGNEDAFHNLLGLLHPDFGRLHQLSGDAYRSTRERLANYFIQRRRRDIDAWREPGLFPKQESTEVQYRLGGDYERFYSDILDYCAEVVTAEKGEQRQRLAFWGTLALMRCVGSSPAAALRALKTRAQLDSNEISESHLTAQILDDEELAEDDLEPGAAVEDPRLEGLIKRAAALSKAIDKDPKYKVLEGTLRTLVKDGFAPVVFCRYIATAEAIGEALGAAFKSHVIDVVTGALPSDEREARVEALGGEDKRILVATDCLSEGINLQASFDAVVHYDLSWNPTRHQQREGRVDRFGQKSPVVRAVLIYGENNPVDGAVLDVILRKARAIERQTGVRVPMPDEGGGLTKALMAAVMLRARGGQQLSLPMDFTDTKEAKEIDIAWVNASKREQKARTIFAQSTLKPDEVADEWAATQRALGGYADTERFVSRAMMRLGAALEPQMPTGYRAPLRLLPENLKDRFVTESLMEEAVEKGLRIDFAARPPAGFVSVHRTHPLPAVLAETFLETALDPYARPEDTATLPRSGIWETPAVDRVTWLLLLRIRHQLHSRGRLGPRFSMAEEAAAVVFDAATSKRLLQNDQAFALLDSDSADVPARIKEAELQRAFGGLDSLRQNLDTFAAERAAVLAEDHTRSRRALRSRADVKVEAVTPADIIGLYVLVPAL